MMGINLKNYLYQGNCLDLMRDIPDEYVDMVLTSPPYDNLRKYDGFCFDFKKTALEIIRTLKPGGVVVWVVNDSVVDGGRTGNSFKQALFFQENGLKIYDTMIWEKPSPAAPTTNRYYDVFEYMFIFSKGKPRTINLIKDRKNKSYGKVSNKETRSNREDRKILSDKRVVPEYSRRFNVWNISRNVNNTSHPAVFPIKLAEDHIKSWTKEGDIVYDPFMGSGTTAKACKNLGRYWLGSEISKTYCDTIRQQLNF